MRRNEVPAEQPRGVEVEGGVDAALREAPAAQPALLISNFAQIIAVIFSTKKNQQVLYQRNVARSGR